MTTPSVTSAAVPEVVLGDDTLNLLTVGVDIGSATSQIVFSDLTLQRQGGRYETVERVVRYQSDVLLTPFTERQTVDSEVLAEFFAVQFDQAGVTPDQVDTGAVILTGVALLRRNAEAIAEIFASDSGRFVSVAAGDGIEALLAAHGSGAVTGSQSAGRLVNVDVGGGTTKISLCVSGRVEAVSAIDIGARLIAWDPSGVIVRVEPSALRIAAHLGMEPAVGEVLSTEDRRRLARHMSAVVADAVCGNWDRPEVADLLRTGPLPIAEESPPVVLSGGMARYVDGGEARSFNDLGPSMAAELPSVFAERGVRFSVAASSIRATVIGASQFTVQVSGTTIHVSGPVVLPVRNVPVATVPRSADPSVMADQDLRRRIARAIELSPADDRALAVSLPWTGSADFATLDAFCDDVLSATDDVLVGDRALILVVDHDVAGLIGAHLELERGLTRPLVVIDGIELKSFDFIDVGDYLDGSSSVPVTIKSLAF